jgi:hypothetical protein
LISINRKIKKKEKHGIRERTMRERRKKRRKNKVRRKEL